MSSFDNISPKEDQGAAAADPASLTPPASSSSLSGIFPSSLLSGPSSARILDRDLLDDTSASDSAATTHALNPPTNTPTSEPAGAPTNPIATPGTITSNASNPVTSPYAPPMNQISMPYIKRHAVKRVKSAKEACNTELQKVIHSITNYFEERLGEKEREDAEEQYAKAQMQQQYMREHQIHSHRQDSQSREASGGGVAPYAGSDDGSTHHSGGTHSSSHLFVGSPVPVPQVPQAAELHAAIQQLHSQAQYREGHGDGMTDADERPLTRSNSRRTADAPSRSHSRQREW